jgi:hypothetical protein
VLKKMLQFKNYLKKQLRPTLYIERYRLTIPPEILEDNGVTIEEKITLTLDMSEIRKHPYPYVDVDSRFDEADVACCLGILVSGKGSTKADFAEWVTRGDAEPWSGTANHPGVNAAMSIIEWMRGESVVQHH